MAAAGHVLMLILESISLRNGVQNLAESRDPQIFWKTLRMPTMNFGVLLAAAAMMTVNGQCPDVDMCATAMFDGTLTAYSMCFKDLTVQTYYGNSIDPSCLGCVAGYTAANNADTSAKCAAIAGAIWLDITCTQAKDNWPTAQCSTFASQQAAQTSNTCCMTADPCFPSSSIVTMADGTLSRLDALKEDNKIVAATAAGALTLDTVSLLSIAKPEARAAFKVLTTATNHTLTLTNEHRIPVGASCCSNLKLAKDVVVGEKVWVVFAGAAVATTVTTTTITMGAGLHSPVLTHGNFPVINGVVTAFDSIDKVNHASPFSTRPIPAAPVGLAPIWPAKDTRAIHSLTRHSFTPLVPSGHARVVRLACPQGDWHDVRLQKGPREDEDAHKGQGVELARWMRAKAKSASDARALSEAEWF